MTVRSKGRDSLGDLPEEMKILETSQSESNVILPGVVLKLNNFWTQLKDCFKSNKDYNFITVSEVWISTYLQLCPGEN